MSKKGRRTTATDLRFEKLLRMPVKWSWHGSDWRIGAGNSNFLIARGSGFSTPVGRAMFHLLKWGVPPRVSKRKARSFSLTSKS